MSKDAYYFSHDANARNDQKILEIRMKYGMRGYGIYFGIIEMMREANLYQCLSNCLSIAYELREPIEDVIDIVKNYDLFELSSDGTFFFSKSFKNRMKVFEDKRNKRIKAGRKGGIASVKQRSSNAQAMLNDCSSSKVKESKVNKSFKAIVKSGDLTKTKFSFSDIYEKYPKRDSRKQSEQFFNATVKNETDYENIQKALKNYLSCTRVHDGFIQSAKTWFKNWTDWITYTEPVSGKVDQQKKDSIIKESRDIEEEERKKTQEEKNKLDEEWEQFSEKKRNDITRSIEAEIPIDIVGNREFMFDVRRRMWQRNQKVGSL